jgi:4-hydroxy-3-methylbut-2-enyl diphosphate reductase
MEVILAKTAGFCFGVKRAVELVYQQIGSEGVYTFGPIIHNEEVVNDLKDKGINVINSLQEAAAVRPGTMIMRSHGAARSIYTELSQMGWNIIDATCPFVKKIHKIVDEESAEGTQIVIVGNEHHPEVEGIMGWCNNTPVVIDSEEKALDFKPQDNKKVCIVSQTTFNYKKFKDIVEIIQKKRYDIFVRNTICNATEERQAEARELAKKSDAMIVIGGKNSSNTQKLFEICKEECVNTYYIQTLRDLDLNKFCCAGCVGITAGASTPNNIIQEVHTYVRI